MANGESPARGALSTLLLFIAVAALAIAAAILAWVQAYSSTRQFERNGRVLLSSSNVKLNPKAVNVRAQLVTPRLTDKDSDGRIQHLPWPRFSDTGGLQGAGREQLNGVVYIGLEDDGAASARLRGGNGRGVCVSARKIGPRGRSGLSSSKA